MAASRVASIVEILAVSDDKLRSLDELKILLSSVSQQELKQVVPNVSILPVFECLNTDDKLQQEVCCNVLEQLLSVLSSDLLLENLHQEFVRWLQQGTIPVQSLCLSQLQRVSQNNPSMLAQNEELLVGIAAQLANSSQHIARLATNILVNLGGTRESLKTVFSGRVFEMLQSVMANDDTVRYRIFQLIVEISSQSPEALDMSNQSGLLMKLINEIHTSDILLQLNCLELMSDLARSNHGLTYLDQQGVIKKLEKMMTAVDCSNFREFLLPGLMKFFGGLARFHPKEVLSHFHTFIEVVFASVAGQGDPVIKGLAIDTIGFIGSIPEGKSALDKQGNTMTDCMEKLGTIIKNSPSDLRARALLAVANLLKLQVADQTGELLGITENWFNHLCTNPFDVIWNIAKQPFTDLKMSSLQVFQSLAFLPWGQQLMNNAAGFKEYLLDRAIETTKDGKEAKFQVVRVLAESPTMADIFGQPYYVQLMEFFHQGPFFVRAQAEVAFEEM